MDIQKKKLEPIRIATMIIAGITAAFITYFTFIYSNGVETIIVIPLYISICVLFLQSGVNRWAFLIGAINSLFYAAVYIHDGLYLTAISAALFSFPVQLITFFRWKKRDTSGKTIFKVLSAKQRALITISYFVLFVLLYKLMKFFGSDWGIYDCSNMLLGILVTVLCAVPYIEYSPLQCVSVLIGLIMFIKMAQQNPLQYTYLTYQIYCMFCVSQALVRIMKIRKNQKECLND